MNSICRNRTATYLDKRTGELHRRRYDPGSGDWVEAGDDKRRVWGPQFVMLSVRSDDYYGRVVTDLEFQHHADGTGGAAGLAMRMIERFKAAAGDGCKAVAYDGALTGRDVNDLMRLGLVAAVPVKAASNPNRAKTGGEGRDEKAATLPACERTGRGGDCHHDLVAQGGRAYECIIDAAGEPRLVPLDWRLVHRPDSTGRMRFMHLVRIPCEANGDHRDVTIRLTLNDQDRRTDLIRPEVLRQLPPGPDEHDHVYACRPDAESLSAQVEQRFYAHRSPATAPTSRSSS